MSLEGLRNSARLATGGGGGGGVTSFNTRTGAVTPSAADYNKLIPTKWFDVQAYGATGNGVTDDLTAVNAAIADLNAAGGGVLYLPEGDYKVSASLTAITGRTLILGFGAKFTCSNFGFTEFLRLGDDCTVQGVTFLASGAAAVVRCNGVHDKIVDCVFGNANAYIGVRLTNEDAQVIDTVFDQFSASLGNGGCVQLDNGSYRAQVDGNIFSGVNGSGAPIILVKANAIQFAIHNNIAVNGGANHAVQIEAGTGDNFQITENVFIGFDVLDGSTGTTKLINDNPLRSGGGGGINALYDVTDYGATGDGVTDDTAAINLAIAALNANHGGWLYYPTGSYLVSGTLTPVAAPALISGSGNGQANSTDAHGAAILSMGNPWFFTNSAGTVVRDLSFINGTGTQLRSDSSRLVVDNVVFRNCGAGVELTYGAVKDCTFYSCTNDGTQPGLIFCFAGNPVSIVDNHFIACTVSEDANHACIAIAANTNNFTVQGNISNGSGTFFNGVFVAGGTSDDYVITGNTFPEASVAVVVDGGTGTNKLVNDNPLRTGGGEFYAPLSEATTPGSVVGTFGTPVDLPLESGKSVVGIDSLSALADPFTLRSPTVYTVTLTATLTDTTTVTAQFIVDNPRAPEGAAVPIETVKSLMDQAAGQQITALDARVQCNQPGNSGQTLYAQLFGVETTDVTSVIWSPSESGIVPNATADTFGTPVSLPITALNAVEALVTLQAIVSGMASETVTVRFSATRTDAAVETLDVVFTADGTQTIRPGSTPDINDLISLLDGNQITAIDVRVKSSIGASAATVTASANGTETLDADALFWSPSAVATPDPVANVPGTPVTLAFSGVATVAEDIFELLMETTGLAADEGVSINYLVTFDDASTSTYTVASGSNGELVISYIGSVDPGGATSPVADFNATNRMIASVTATVTAFIDDSAASVTVGLNGTQSQGSDTDWANFVGVSPSDTVDTDGAPVSFTLVNPLERFLGVKNTQPSLQYELLHVRYVATRDDATTETYDLASSFGGAATASIVASPAAVTANGSIAGADPGMSTFLQSLDQHAVTSLTAAFRSDKEDSIAQITAGATGSQS